VNVGVAIGAILADIRKYRFHVALIAQDFFVHSAQGIARFVMVKFRIGTDGPPARIYVAVIAGKREWAMRASGIGLLCEHTGRGQYQSQEDPDPDLSDSGRTFTPRTRSSIGRV